MLNKALIIVLTHSSAFKNEFQEDTLGLGHKEHNVTSIKLFLTLLENFAPGKFQSARTCRPALSAHTLARGAYRV